MDDQRIPAERAVFKRAIDSPEQLVLALASETAADNKKGAAFLSGSPAWFDCSTANDFATQEPKLAPDMLGPMLREAVDTRNRLDSDVAAGDATEPVNPNFRQQLERLPSPGS